MRNKYGGTCYMCQKYVEPGAGHFQRHGHGWVVQHAECAIKNRKRKQHLRTMREKAKSNG